MLGDIFIMPSHSKSTLSGRRIVASVNAAFYTTLRTLLHYHPVLSVVVLEKSNSNLILVCMHGLLFSLAVLQNVLFVPDVLKFHCDESSCKLFFFLVFSMSSRICEFFKVGVLHFSFILDHYFFSQFLPCLPTPIYFYLLLWLLLHRS